MQLTLFVPGLLLPGSVLRDTAFDLATPALALLLGRGRHAALAEDWLARAFGLAAPLPTALLRQAATGKEVEGDWLCLDPVHWRVTREGVFLADPALLDLDLEESAALVAALRPLFAPWGELSAGKPHQWTLRLARPLQLETRSLPAVIGQPVDPALPAGADGPTWRRLLAEAQMRLHAHPVNQRRAEAERLRVNSLWPWGSGSLATRPACHFSAVWGDDPLLAGLCALAARPCHAPPADFRPVAGATLARIDRLLMPARQRDAQAWRQALVDLERDWIAPALAALRRGGIGDLHLVASDAGERRTLGISLSRGALWRFWRRPRPLAALDVPT